MKSHRPVFPIAALALLVACGSEPETTEPPAPAPPAQAEAPPPAPPEPTPKPQQPAGTPDAGRGETLYASYCASCHGPRGEGDGPLAATLDPKPARHSDAAYMNALSDEHLFKVIKEGGPAVGKSPLMAPWGSTMSDAQIRDVVAFVRSLSKG